MNLLPDAQEVRVLLSVTATVLICAGALISGSAAGDDRNSLPTMDDARNMIEADRQEFLAIVEPDKRDAEKTQKRPARLEKSSVSGPDGPRSEGGDPALDDFAAYELLIETDPGSPDNVELLTSRAELFTERGFHDRAIEDLLVSFSLDIDNQTGWHRLGRVHEMKGQLETAQAAYDETIVSGPETEAGIAAQWDRETLALIGDDDRRTTILELGMPDAFTLLMIASGPDSQTINRHETWYYYRAGTRFDFVNGTFVEGADIEDADFETVEAIFAPYRPYQFSPNLSLEDVADITGAQDYVVYELGDTPIEGGELVYTRQLALGFKNGSLFYVRAFPLFTDE